MRPKMSVMTAQIYTVTKHTVYGNSATPNNEWMHSNSNSISKNNTFGTDDSNTSSNNWKIDIVGSD